MARNDLVVFRVNENERQLLKRLAATMERNESDTVRAALREAARARRLLPDPTPPAAPAEKQAA